MQALMNRHSLNVGECLNGPVNHKKASWTGDEWNLFNVRFPLINPESGSSVPLISCITLQLAVVRHCANE
jgi:hypothetical protein